MSYGRGYRLQNGCSYYDGLMCTVISPAKCTYARDSKKLGQNSDSFKEIFKIAVSRIFVSYFFMGHHK